MVAAIASISEDGWVTDSTKILDYVLSHYILTDNMQSLVFQGKLISLSYTYFQYINDPDNMAIQVTSDLQTLLGRYFQTTDVLVETRELDNKKYAIAVYAAAIDSKGVKVDISKAIQIDTSRSRQVVNLNNYGDAVDLINSL